MNVALVCLLVAGLFGNSFAATVSSSNDATMKQVVDKAKAGLEKLLESAESASEKIKDRSVDSLKDLPAQYIKSKS